VSDGFDPSNVSRHVRVPNIDRELADVADACLSLGFTVQQGLPSNRVTVQQNRSTSQAPTHDLVHEVSEVVG
jgi:hypothetical protein